MDTKKISRALSAAADCFFRGADDFMFFHDAAAGNVDLQVKHAAEARILQTWGSALRAAADELNVNDPSK